MRSYERVVMHYAVAYGHVTRIERASGEAEAARLAFGIVDQARMTVRQLPKSPRSLSQKAMRTELEALGVRHFRKTGNVLSGCEKVPGIKNVHRTECTKCRRPILTEPASAGCDDVECQVCHGVVTA